MKTNGIFGGFAAIACAVWLPALGNGAVAVAKPGDDFVGSIREDLKSPVLKDGEGRLWTATLAEVSRLDEAADAQWSACKSPEAVKARQAKLKAEMVRAIGGFPERNPLNATVTERIPRDGYRIEKVHFESQPHFYETGLFYRPDGDGPFPAVAVACGHSGNGKGSKDYQCACVMAAKSGIASFIYDPVDQGERTQLKGDGGNVHGHNRIGIRAALLGWSMARFRVWDAMRALDYLSSRPDVDAKRLGFMGNSGGGTLTSLAMALDGRIRSAAPSCYLSTIRDVCTDCGPQDAEQNIFGQLAFGLNHLGYVAMRAPAPTLMVCKEKDFFPIRGSRATEKLAREVYRVAGGAWNYDLFAAPGGHGWAESTRTASLGWMRRSLKDEVASFGGSMYGSFVGKDKGFDIKKVDFGLNPGFEVSPGGNVRNLPGAVTAYDIMRGEAARQASLRKGVTAAEVKRMSGMREIAELPADRVRWGKPVARDGYSAESCRIEVEPGVVLTAKALKPTGKTCGLPVLILPSEGRAQADRMAAEFLAAGRAVMVAELRGSGETAGGGHRFYGSDYPEEGIAAMAYLAGRSLVGMRAEDAIRLSRIWAQRCGAGGVAAVSVGRSAIPLAHAARIDPDSIVTRTMFSPPPAWSKWFECDSDTVHYTDLVNGAYGTYDWTDL